MHYIAILTFIGFITLATGGHSAAFGQAYEAVVRGDVENAVELFGTALRRTLKDADAGPAACEAGKIVLVALDDYSVRSGRGC